MSIGPRRTTLGLIVILTVIIGLVLGLGLFLIETTTPNFFGAMGLIGGLSLLAAIVIATGILQGTTLLQNIVAMRKSFHELGNLHHPLLERLAKEAPGTYHHSLVVGNLAAAAAKAIDANDTLARIGGYYHDIGKIKRPNLFIENIDPNKDPHFDMDPRDSAQVIIQHVIDGIELARQYKLPSEVADFIPQHTGTTLVYFFYDKAKRQSAGRDLYKRDFRYPGPKPMSRETAIVMLADTVEAAVRAHKPSTDVQLRAVIDEVVSEKIEDTQLDISGMTKRDIKRVQDAFFGVLERMNHQRVKYPKRAKRTNHLA